MMEEIKFICYDTPTEKFSDIDLSCIYLYNKVFIRKISGKCTTDGKEDFFLESIAIAHEHICRVDMFWHQINQQYYVEISLVNGDETKTFFEDFKECENVYKKIKFWRFGI